MLLKKLKDSLEITGFDIEQLVIEDPPKLEMIYTSSKSPASIVYDSGSQCQYQTLEVHHDSLQTGIDFRHVHPFVKWPGGKRQLLSKLDKLIPTQFNRYFCS